MIKPFFLGLLLLLISHSSFAQLTLLKDISHIYDAQTSGLNPQHITDVNGTLFFNGLSDKGFELWKSDGTAAGTVLVKDILPGVDGSNPTELVHVNGTLYFIANDGVHGRELWKSDGTADGTTLVKDFSHGPWEVYYNNYSSITALRAAGDYLYFLEYWGTGGSANYNLWRSDGSTEGTFIIREQVIDSWDGFLIAEANGITYFVCRDPASGYELWKTDGTKEGTSIVKDIVPGIYSSGPRNFKVYKNTLFFVCNSDAGYEVWKTDGTEAGTVILKDIEVGPSVNDPRHLHVINNTLIFQAYDGSSLGLWKSDGTEAGTVKIVSTEVFTGSASSESMIFYTNQVVVGSHYETKLWRTDGTAGGTFLVKQFASSFYENGDPDHMVPMNDAVYFVASSGGDPNHLQLWRSDGTTAGTSMMTSIIFDDPASGVLLNNMPPRDFTVINNNLYFCTNDERKGNELWKTDGTMAGTTMITDIPEASFGSVASDFTKLNDLVIFIAADEVGSLEVWRSDKTPQGTFMLKDIYPGGPRGNTSSPSGLTVYHDYVYFSAYPNSDTGFELWRTDGSAAGTQLFKDLNTGGSSYPTNFKVLNDVLLFTANGDELWKCDGTPGGTQLIKDVAAGPAQISDFAEFNGKIYFSVAGELWESDGTTTGTVKKTAVTGLNYFSIISADTKFFTSAAGQDLWKTDGTEAGTSLLKHFQTISTFSSRGSYVATRQGTLFFKATEANTTTDYALWKSDGTVAGTSKVSDLYLGFPGTEQIASVDNLILFTAYDDDHGLELWKTDGTTVQLVKDIWDGKGSGGPANFMVIGDYLYFTAYDGSHRGLWKTNGEESGTVEAANEANISLDRLHESAVIGNTIFIRGYELPTGEEVYMYDVEVEEPVTGTEVLTNNQILVYPNPTSQKLRIQTPNLEGKRKIRVLSASGIELTNQEYSNVDFDLDVSAYPSGLYVLKIVSPKGIFVTKFVKK